MLKFILSKIITLLEDNPIFNTNKTAIELLAKIKAELASYKHINFYAIDAEAQIANTQQKIEEYLSVLTKISDRVTETLEPCSEFEEIKTKISNIIEQLGSKQRKLALLKRKIPQGILDVKRALYIANGRSLSSSVEEDAEYKKQLLSIQNFMSGLNKHYNAVISQGGKLESFLSELTTFYWVQLGEYRQRVKQLLTHFEISRQLTKEGQFVKHCITHALTPIPSEKKINQALGLITQSHVKSKQRILKQIGITSETGLRVCSYLSSRKKQFFHMPSSDERYHFDYDPTEDLAGTGGNCHGEALVFIDQLQLGKFKQFCPESMVLNFQLEQTRELKFGRETLDEAETVVSEESEHQSLQWEDMQDVLIANPNFKPGDLCALKFFMNDYTKSQRDFTSGHVAVLAKLDRTLSRYSYVVFEKDFGAFGLEDEDDLKYVIEALMSLYSGMNYSKLKIVKYGEATQETYRLIGNIAPLVEHQPLAKADTHAFFPGVRQAEAGAIVREELTSVSSVS